MMFMVQVNHILCRQYLNKRHAVLLAFSKSSALMLGAVRYMAVIRSLAPNFGGATMQ